MRRIPIPRQIPIPLELSQKLQGSYGIRTQFIKDALHNVLPRMDKSLYYKTTLGLEKPLKGMVNFDLAPVLPLLRSKRQELESQGLQTNFNDLIRVAMIAYADEMMTAPRGKGEKEMSEITVKNPTRSRKWGWAYSTTPTGEDAYSIKVPTSPDYVGTLNQIYKSIEGDRNFNNLGGAFHSVRWFYNGNAIHGVKFGNSIHPFSDWDPEFDTGPVTLIVE